jgi:ankyrin repeat protein
MDKNKERLTIGALCSKNDKGNTPLYIAVAYRHLETVRYLLERGVNVDAKNENGNTVLHKAFMN